LRDGLRPSLKKIHSINQQYLAITETGEEQLVSALLIAGTDTGVGKTVLTLAMAAYWQRHCGNQRLGIFKPIACDPQDVSADAQRYAQLGLSQSISEINPIHLASTAVPAIASRQCHQRIELETIWQQFEQLRSQREFTLVEGVGGLGTPITKETTMADLAWDWRLPTILVVPVVAGAIAQTVANVALADQSRVHLKGIVLNCCDRQAQADIDTVASPALLESLTQKPVLGCIPYLSDPNNMDQLARVASDLEIENIVPMLV
jgi:dethiobiotin synthetase